MHPHVVLAYLNLKDLLPALTFLLKLRHFDSADSCSLLFFHPPSFSLCAAHPPLLRGYASPSPLAWSRWRPGEKRWFFRQAFLYVPWLTQDPAQGRPGSQAIHWLLIPLHSLINRLVHTHTLLSVNCVWTLQEEGRSRLESSEKEMY